MKYSENNLRKFVNEVDTVSDLVRKIRGKEIASPSSIAHVSKKLKEFNIDTTHFVGSSKGFSNLKVDKKSFSEILIFDLNKKNRVSRLTLLNAIKKSGKLEYKCDICSNEGIYNNKELKLHIDHIDGNWKNNLISNLRFLCPNCHSQTETYGFNGTVKY